jgi:hypothetical protein
MQKITLPLVMIASLTTLVSCGGTPNATTPTRPVAPVVTGVVVTPLSTVTATPSTGSTPVVPTPTAPLTPVTQSPVPMVPATPVVIKHTQAVSYEVPGSTESTEFTIIITDGIVTATSAVPQAGNEVSMAFQKAFAAEFASKVV